MRIAHEAVAEEENWRRFQAALLFAREQLVGAKGRKRDHWEAIEDALSREHEDAKRSCAAKLSWLKESFEAATTGEQELIVGLIQADGLAGDCETRR
jgi:hypothetical protein